MAIGESFENWMKRVNVFIVLSIGIGAADLDDYCYRDDYESNISAAAAARRAIRQAKANSLRSERL